MTPFFLSAPLPQTLRLNIEELQLLGEAWADRHRVLERSLTSSSSSSSASAASGKPAAGASSSASSTNAHIRVLSALFRHRDTSVDEKEVIEDRLEVRRMRRTDICDKIPHQHVIGMSNRRLIRFFLERNQLNATTVRNIVWHICCIAFLSLLFLDCDPSF